MRISRGTRSDVGVETAIISVSLAVQRAVDSCPSVKGRPFTSVPFTTIWAGLAGHDRSTAAAPINTALSKLFDRQVGPSLKISNDIELLVTTIANQKHVNSMAVLQAGTGSIAMSYVRDSDQFKQTGRVGGWGYLLGDDGSGYAIGREALKIALETADELNLRNKSGLPLERVGALAQRVFEHFGLDSQNKQIQLLDAVLSPKTGENRSGISTKKRIAELARVVFDASPVDELAGGIIQANSQKLTHILSSLISNQDLDSTKMALVLAGGLMQNEEYNGKIVEGLRNLGMNFASIEHVGEPALIAARYLIQNIST